MHHRLVDGGGGVDGGDALAVVVAAAAAAAAPRNRTARSRQGLVGLEGETAIGGSRHNGAGDVGRVGGDGESRRSACREIVPGASGLARCRRGRSDLDVLMQKSRLEYARLPGPVGAS